MKKCLVAAVLMLLTGVLLIGCGSGKKEVTAGAADIYADIQSQVSLAPMLEYDSDYIYNLYGIDTALLDDFIFVEAEDGLKVDAVVLMKINEETDVEAVKESLNTVIEQKKSTMNNYIPEQYEIACNAVLESEGNFVYLVISKDVDQIKEVIDSYIK